MELSVQKREILGTRVKALRKQGFIPAELYGKGLENIHVSVPMKDFRKVYKTAGESTVVTVLLDGKKYPVLINDVSFDRITNEFESADLYQIRMDEKLKVGVPVEFIGLSLAVKEKNGVLVKALQELEVEALPMDLPHDIKADVSKIVEIGQSVYVKDLDIPKGVRVLVDPETVVATVTAKVTEEEELAMQQKAAGGVEEVKVETEEKKAERDATKAVTGEAAPGAAPKAGAAPAASAAPKK